jgi:hypothetical protein
MRLFILLLVAPLAFAAGRADNLTYQPPPVAYRLSPAAQGPDGYGYYYLSTQDPGDTLTFQWIDATPGTHITNWTPNPDDGYATINLPFDFPYYDQALPSIKVGINGLLASTSPTEYTNTALPNGTLVNLIAPFWDDLYLASGGVYYYEPADHSCFVIEYLKLARFDTPTDLETFEIVMYPDGRLRFNYLDLNGVVNSNTVGIQGQQGANNWYLQYACNGSPAPHVVRDSTSVLFYAPHHDHDVGVTGIVSPGPYVAPGSTHPVQVTVKNFGRETENFYVRGFIYNSQSPYDTIFQATPSLVHDFAAQDTQTVLLGNFLVPGQGAWCARLFTALDSDQQPGNDTMTRDLATTLDFGTQLGSWNLPNLGSGFNLGGITCCPDSNRFYLTVHDPNRIYSFQAQDPIGTLRNESFQLQSFFGDDVIWGIAFDRVRHCFWIGHVPAAANATICARYGLDGRFTGDTWNLAAVESNGWFAGIDYDELGDYYWLTRVGGTNYFYKLDLPGHQVLGHVIGPQSSYRACACLPAKGWLVSGGWNQNRAYQIDTLGGILNQATLDSLADAAFSRPTSPPPDSLVYLMTTLSNNANTVVKIALGKFWSQLGVEQGTTPQFPAEKLWGCPQLYCPQVQRNPCRLTLQLGRPMPVRVALYEPNGRQRTVLATGFLPAGEHRLSVTARLQSGTYFLLVMSPNQTECRKLVIIE